MRTLVIWGAGRIGRGFVAPMFLEGGWNVVFVDIDKTLVDRLNERKGYTILRADKNGIVSERIEGGFKALHTSQTEALNELFGLDGLMLDIAVHEPELSAAADMIAPLIEHRAGSCALYMDIMMNVNMASPDEAFIRMMDERLEGESLSYFHDRVGVTGIAAMCISPVAPAEELIKDPLTLINNNWPEQAIGLPQLKGIPVDLPRIRLTDNVRAEETRKLYTLNMAHAVCSYLGIPEGHSTVIDVMRDGRLRDTVTKAILEASEGLIKAYGFDENVMKGWPGKILDLLDNPWINDDLPRLGADTRRKLSRFDRLTGPAMLCLEAGGCPVSIAKAIRAGFDFTHDDPGTRFVTDTVKNEGIEAAVETVCGINAGDDLGKMILGR